MHIEWGRLRSNDDESARIVVLIVEKSAVNTGTDIPLFPKNEHIKGLKGMKIPKNYKKCDQSGTKWLKVDEKCSIM
jgi:hypothetical protein